MKVDDFERPREKLRRNGVGTLTDSELVQAILGFGSPQASVAKLARSVVSMMSRGTVSYTDLISLTGLGQAKAGQVLASLELGRRFEKGYMTKVAQSLPPAEMRRCLQMVRSARGVAAVVCCWQNADGSVIASWAYELVGHRSADSVVKAIMTDASSLSARQLVLFIRDRRSSVNLGAASLRLVDSVRAAVDYVGLTVGRVYLVSQSDYYQVQGEGGRV